VIPITNAEVWALNMLNGGVDNAQAELQRAIAARGSYISLIEGKYRAKFDPDTGEFTPLEEEAPEAKAAGKPKGKAAERDVKD